MYTCIDFDTEENVDDVYVFNLTELKEGQWIWDAFA